MGNNCSPGCRWWCLWWRLFVLSFFPTRCLGWDLGRNWVSFWGISSYSFILEVDLEYAEDLHNAHNAYPLAPERMVVQKKWMSEYQHNLLGVGVAPTEVENLVPNLRNKDRFIIGICSYTRLWACVWPKSIAPSGSTKALGWSHTSGWIQSSGKRPPATLK